MNGCCLYKICRQCNGTKLLNATVLTNLLLGYLCRRGRNVVGEIIGMD